MNGNKYECHITLEPALDRLDELDRLCNWHGFRRAKLLMDKGDRIDQFVSFKGNDLPALNIVAEWFKRNLELNDFKVRRLKIEEILFDERYEKNVKQR